MNGPIVTYELAWPDDLPACLRSLAAGRELAWLDSADADDPAKRPDAESLVAIDPVAVLSQDDSGPARLTAGDRVIAEAADGWRLWRQVQEQCGKDGSGTPRNSFVEPGFGPGWVGYVGYPMGRCLERFAASKMGPAGLPRMRLALFDEVLVLRHADRSARCLRVPGVRSRLGLPERSPVATPHLLKRWLESVGAPPHHSKPLPPSESVPFTGIASRAAASTAAVAARARAGAAAPSRIDIAARLLETRSTHEQRVRRALEYIAAGDVYQVNLAHALLLEDLPDPFDLHLALRRGNPAAYAALLRWDACAVVSASPELFVDVYHARVRTRPIKGTRPRTGDPRVDAAARRALRSSPKDAAELAMIVDLHRNDLGRVCRPGSIRVTQPRLLEEHPRVFHTRAEIVGRLSPSRDALDLLAASFPAGSVTGVPKIRAMEIIDELEADGRGVYTGAIGWLGLGGDMRMSVAIRVLQIRGRRAWLHVGGGIVADSEPALEYEETLAKARGLLEALGAEWSCATAL